MIFCLSNTKSKVRGSTGTTNQQSTFVLGHFRKRSGEAQPPWLEHPLKWRAEVSVTRILPQLIVPKKPLHVTCFWICSTPQVFPLIHNLCFLVQVFSIAPAGHISHIVILTKTWKPKIMNGVVGSNDATAVRQMASLVLELQGLGITSHAVSQMTLSSVLIHCFVVFCARLIDDVINTQVLDIPAREPDEDVASIAINTFGSMHTKNKTLAETHRNTCCFQIAFISKETGIVTKVVSEVNFAFLPMNSSKFCAS